jgi:Protein of unknown function (DUF992)
MANYDFSRLTLISILALAAITAPAAADNKIKSGILECDVSAGVGLIFSEKQTMNCKFTPLGGGEVDHYTGTIDEVGLSIGATESGILVGHHRDADLGAVAALVISALSNHSRLPGHSAVT